MDYSHTPMVKNTKRALVFFVISLLVLGLVLFFSQKNGYLQDTRNNFAKPATQDQPSAVQTSLRLMSETGATRYAQSEQVRLVVSANSAQKDIIGYDLLVSFDPTYFGVVSVTPLDSRYQTVPFNKEGLVSITGTKSPSITEAALLEDTSLVSVVLQPMKKGSSQVTVVPAVGPERTKMIDASSNIHIPQVAPIVIEVY